MANSRTYHHGELRHAVMSAALDAIAQEGVSALSLRKLAKVTGVSHGAPAHHFGDRKGLFTALAIAGCELLMDNLQHAIAQSADDDKARLQAAGIAYVQFAVDNPAYFEVMFKPELHQRDNPELRKAFKQARQLLGETLVGTIDVGSSPAEADHHMNIAALRAWSMAHGLASLILSGNLGSDTRKIDAAALGAAVFV